MQLRTSPKGIANLHIFNAEQNLILKKNKVLKNQLI